jgi:phospholipid transport system substrate-binding protein
MLQGAVMAGLLASATRAQQNPSPTEILKRRDETLQKLAASVNTPQGEASVRQAIVESFDFREHSRISLGKYWKERTRAEQDEFVAVMRSWTENRAIKKMLKRSEKTTYASEEITGDLALVKTVVMYRNTKTLVDYKMRLNDGKWQIVDMYIDGASVALANRDAFYKKISKTSYQELVNTLKAKTLETS